MLGHESLPNKAAFSDPPRRRRLALTHKPPGTTPGGRKNSPPQRPAHQMVLSECWCGGKGSGAGGAAPLVVIALRARRDGCPGDVIKELLRNRQNRRISVRIHKTLDNEREGGGAAPPCCWCSTPRPQPCPRCSRPPWPRAGCTRRTWREAAQNEASGRRRSGKAAMGDGGAREPRGATYADVLFIV